MTNKKTREYRQQPQGYTLFIAHFTDLHQITASTEEFKSRLDFYNWICKNRLGKGHGELTAIECKPRHF